MLSAPRILLPPVPATVHQRLHRRPLIYHAVIFPLLRELLFKVWPVSTSLVKKTEAISDIEKRPLKRSNSSNQFSHVDTHFVPFIRHKLGGRTRKSTEVNLKSRMQMKLKRQELLQKATKIKSLDNSPANEHQLLVLRMVFDEITMYPCESWIVLIAIIIRRAYKQVKNWFLTNARKTEAENPLLLRQQTVIGFVFEHLRYQLVRNGQIHLWKRS